MSLPAARREAVAIAALFDAPPPLVGQDATIARFRASAPLSALIHYAGHARSDDTAGGFLPLAPSGDSDGHSTFSWMTCASRARTEPSIR